MLKKVFKLDIRFYLNIGVAAVFKPPAALSQFIYTVDIRIINSDGPLLINYATSKLVELEPGSTRKNME